MPEDTAPNESSLPADVINDLTAELQRRGRLPASPMAPLVPPNLELSPFLHHVRTAPYEACALPQVETPVQYQSSGYVWKQAMFAPDTGVLSIGVGLGDASVAGGTRIERPPEELADGNGMLNLTVSGHMTHVFQLPPDGRRRCTVTAKLNIPGGKFCFDALYNSGATPDDEPRPFFLVEEFVPRVTASATMTLFGARIVQGQTQSLGDVRFGGYGIWVPYEHVPALNPIQSRQVTLEVSDVANAPSGALIAMVTVTLTAWCPPPSDTMVDGRHVSASYDMLQPGMCIDCRKPIKLYKSFRTKSPYLYGDNSSGSGITLESIAIRSARIERGRIPI